MLLYFLIFLIAFSMAFISEKLQKRNHRILFILFSVLAIVIPSIMAGIRQSGIGTDTKVYMDSVFKSIYHLNSFSQIFDYCRLSGMEFLYCTINFIVSRFSNSLTSIYFVIELIILLFTYLGCITISKRLNISYSFSYLVFLILFFNKSLNMSRQSIAMAICLASIPFILDRKLVNFLLLMIVGYGFHKSIILFAPLYFIYPLCVSDRKESKLITIIIAFLLISGIVLFKNILVLLINSGIISSKYILYITKYGDSSNIKAIELLSQIGLIVLIMLFNNRLIKYNKINRFLSFIIIISIISFLIGFNASYLQRISFYYSIIIIFIIPQIPKLYNNITNKYMITGFIMLLLSLYSYFYYGKYQFDQTVPYIIAPPEYKIIS